MGGWVEIHKTQQALCVLFLCFCIDRFLINLTLYSLSGVDSSSLTGPTRYDRLKLCCLKHWMALFRLTWWKSFNTFSWYKSSYKATTAVIKQTQGAQSATATQSHSRLQTNVMWLVHDAVLLSLPSYELACTFAEDSIPICYLQAGKWWQWLASPNNFIVINSDWPVWGKAVANEWVCCQKLTTQPLLYWLNITYAYIMAHSVRNGCET